MSKIYWAIGIDLGGTKIEFALVNSSGEVRDRIRIPTNMQQGYKVILKHITESIQQLCNQNVDIIPLCIGIGVAGQISKSSGIVHYAPNLDWHEVKLQDDLSAMLHKTVFVCNDVRAATWGEWLHGAGKSCDDLVCIFIGTGIGGGIISNGQMLIGCNNSAGEIGHTTIDKNGPECHCGNIGCFEALAGGWAIERDARRQVSNDPQSGKIMLEMAENKIDNITARTVIEAAQKKDILACKIVDDIANAIVIGSSSIVNTVGPCKLIFGGGIIEGMPQLLRRIEKGLKLHSLKAATSIVEVLPAKLHNDSGVIGAAAFALDSLNKSKNLTHKKYTF